MTDDVIAALERNDATMPVFYQTMLGEAKDLIKLSAYSMTGKYTDWDAQDLIYRGFRAPDKEDREQQLKENPVKMIVPNTYAQIMTFTSFLFLLFKQNETMYELSPNRTASWGKTKSDCEQLLDHNMRYNQQNILLFNQLLDIARFGVGITEVSWMRKLSKINVQQQPQVITVNGVDIVLNAGTDWQDVVKYEGNLVRNVSPYHFFPDPRHSLAEFHKGDFCGCEEEYGYAELHELQNNDEVAGIEHIEPLTDSYINNIRGGVNRFSFELNQRYRDQWTRGSIARNAPVVVTKLQRWIIPNQYEVDPSKKKKLGPEGFPVLYHLWYANENRLIRLEPCGWWHNEFGWTVGEFTPDMHQTISMSLADIVGRLQEVITWLYNMRIKDIRRNVFGRNVVDPRIIDTKTLDDDGDIYMRKSMSSPIERAFMALPMNNVTQGHLNEAQMISQTLQIVSGVNDNMQGQTGSGRRAAREIGAANAGATGRMKMHGELIWETGPGRQGRLMLSNLRQGLSFDSFAALIDGDIDPLTGQSDQQARYQAFKGDPRRIAMGTDYFTYDSITGSEKGQLAQNLQELLTIILQTNPMAAAQMSMQIDPGQILDEMMRLRGTGPLKRFQQQPQQRPGLPPGFGGVGQ